MKTLDFYVARQIIKPLASALFVAVLVLLLERLLRLLDLILGSDGPVGIFFQIMAYLVPEYAGLALPMSLLLGVMLGFNQLSRDGEIDAFQASGLGLRYQARSAFAIGMIITILTGLIVGYVKPFSRYAYQSVVYAATETALNVLLRPNVFAEMGAMTVFIEGIRPETGTFTDVFLYEGAEDGGSTVITARDGALTRSLAGGVPILRLFDGVRLSIGGNDRELIEQDKSTTVGVLRFNELRTAMSEDSAGLFRPRGGDRREYTLDELWKLRNNPPDGLRTTDMVSELHSRIVQTLSIPVLPFLAIALGLVGRRRSDKIYGIAIGLLILVGYNQLLEFGKNLVQDSDSGPFIALWLPFVVFTIASLSLFYRASECVPKGLFADIINTIGDAMSNISRRLAPPGGKTTG